MSFCGEVKSELSKVEAENKCCRHAQAYGMLLFGKTFSSTDIKFKTEYCDVAELLVKTIKNELDCVPSDKFENCKKYTIEVTGKVQTKKIFNRFGHSEKDISLRINRANIENDCCFSSFLRGVFLSCGTISDPEKNYHVEFVVPYLKLSKDLLQIISELGFNAGHVVRNSNHVIYLKNSENIEDILTYMGAPMSSLKVMGIKMTKNVKNKINRQMNFENANMTRTIDAGLAQVDAIKLIKKYKKFDLLNDELKELAQLRLENPDMSLKELGKNLATPISRSGVNHRLSKIISIADEISFDKKL